MSFLCKIFGHKFPEQHELHLWREYEYRNMEDFGHYGIETNCNRCSARMRIKQGDLFPKNKFAEVHLREKPTE